MRRLYINIAILISVMFSSLIVSAENNDPFLLISTVYYFNDDDTGYLGPEIVIDCDGNWRQADLKDLWIGQQFQTFLVEGESEIKEPIIITVKYIDEYIAQCNVEPKIDSSFLSMAVYKKAGNDKNKKINFNAIGPLIELQKTDEKTNLLLHELFVEDEANIIEKLYNVINNDFINIKNYFQKDVQMNIKDYLLGDLNGDGIDDIVVILGDKYFGAPESGPAVIIAYLQIDGKYFRLPISYWEETSDYYSWPKLLFTKDFNDDNAEELFIGEATSDSTVPIVYSWFGNGLRKVYQGKIEFWKF